MFSLVRYYRVKSFNECQYICIKHLGIILLIRKIHDHTTIFQTDLIDKKIIIILLLLPKIFDYCYCCHLNKTRGCVDDFQCGNLRFALTIPTELKVLKYIIISSKTIFYTINTVLVDLQMYYDCKLY